LLENLTVLNTEYYSIYHILPTLCLQKQQNEQYCTAVFVQYLQRGIFMRSPWSKVVDESLINTSAKASPPVSWNTTLPQVIVQGSFLRVSLHKKVSFIFLAWYAKIHVKTGSILRLRSNLASYENWNLRFGKIVKNLIVVKRNFRFSDWGPDYSNQLYVSTTELSTLSQ